MNLSMEMLDKTISKSRRRLPKAQARVTLLDLVGSGLLKPGDKVMFDQHYATIMANGVLYTGETTAELAALNLTDNPVGVPYYLKATYASLSSWCADVRRMGSEKEVTVSGWVKARLASDLSRTMDSLRKDYVELYAPESPKSLREEQEDSPRRPRLRSGKVPEENFVEEVEELVQAPIPKMQVLSLRHQVCMECGGVVEDELECNSCGESYHEKCTRTDICGVEMKPWICINCTSCNKCLKSIPRQELGKCLLCNIVYHCSCVHVSQELLRGFMMCDQCAVCYSCGLKPRGQIVEPPLWTKHPHAQGYQCQLCATYYESGNYCSVCLRSYPDDDFETPMFGCDGPCKKWIHKQCDDILEEMDIDKRYLCPVCRGTNIVIRPKEYQRKFNLKDERVCSICFKGEDPFPLIYISSHVHSSCLYWSLGDKVDQTQYDSFLMQIKSNSCFICSKQNANVFCCCDKKYHLTCLLENPNGSHLDVIHKHFRCPSHATVPFRPYFPVKQDLLFLQNIVIQFVLHNLVEQKYMNFGSTLLLDSGVFPFDHQDKLLDSGILVPINYTVEKRFWSYKTPLMTWIQISRVVVNKENHEQGIVKFGFHSDAEQTLLLKKLDVVMWKITFEDDVSNYQYVESIPDIFPHILSMFDSPLPVGINNHYLLHPESIVLLHIPCVLKLIENKQFASQTNNYNFKFIDPVLVRQAESAIFRGSARTDPLIPVSKSKSFLCKRFFKFDNSPLLESLDTMYMNMRQSPNFFIKPSKIQGLGLFSNKEFKKGDMIIEYLGEIVGQKVSDKRELKNEESGTGTYFFGIEHDYILDASVFGNPSRYINHSCDPNCYAKIIHACGAKRVVIFASRRIMPSEEFTYDYKFQQEDDKIKCYCGAQQCRKFLN